MHSFFCLAWSAISKFPFGSLFFLVMDIGRCFPFCLYNVPSETSQLFDIREFCALVLVNVMLQHTPKWRSTLLRKRKKQDRWTIFPSFASSSNLSPPCGTCLVLSELGDIPFFKIFFGCLLTVVKCLGDLSEYLCLHLCRFAAKKLANLCYEFFKQKTGVWVFFTRLWTRAYNDCCQRGFVFIVVFHGLMQWFLDRI